MKYFFVCLALSIPLQSFAQEHPVAVGDYVKFKLVAIYPHKNNDLNKTEMDIFNVYNKEKEVVAIDKKNDNFTIKVTLDNGTHLETASLSQENNNRKLWQDRLADNCGDDYTPVHDEAGSLIGCQETIKDKVRAKWEKSVKKTTDTAVYGLVPFTLRSFSVDSYEKIDNREEVSRGWSTTSYGRVEHRRQTSEGLLEDFHWGSLK